MCFAVSKFATVSYSTIVLVQFEYSTAQYNIMQNSFLLATVDYSMILYCTSQYSVSSTVGATVLLLQYCMIAETTAHDTV